MSSQVAFDEVMIASKVSSLLEKVRALRVEIGALENDLEALLPEVSEATETDELTRTDIAASEADERLELDPPLFSREAVASGVVEAETGIPLASIDQKLVDELPTILHAELIDDEAAAEENAELRYASDPQREEHKTVDTECTAEKEQTTFNDVSDSVHVDIPIHIEVTDESIKIEPAWSVVEEVLLPASHDIARTVADKNTIEPAMQGALIVLSPPAPTAKPKRARYFRKLAIAASLMIFVGTAAFLKPETLTPFFLAMSGEHCLTGLVSGQTACVHEWLSETTTDLANRFATRRIF